LGHREERSDVAIQRRLLDWFAALAMTVLLFFAAPVSAQTFPQLTGRVVDNAHLLTPAQVVDLTTKSEALEAQTKRQFVVATVPSLEGRSVEDYGYKLGRAWGIGQKGKNDGVILLVAPNEHKVRVETGYSATVFLTDAMSGIIIRNSILPYFKQSPPDYGAGIEAGADQIIKQMSLPPEEAQKNVAAAEQAQQAHQHSGAGALPGLFWFMIMGFVFLSMLRRGQGQRYRGRSGGISPWVVLWGLNALSRGSRGGGWGGGGWSSGGGGWGGGGGFGGFSGGGGSFGGGGASGSW
jgi:uncharacterized protein